jgi:three-Cys-motif partner protein
MPSEEPDLYLEREQTRIKHLVLEKYLERFARIVGQWAGGILYIDGFSGPWNTVSEDFKDSSFAIALRELRAARETVRQVHRKDLRIQCVFLEKDPAAFHKLRDYAIQQTDADITPLNKPFEEAVPELVRIAESSKRSHFPFILIDPKGWKGFAMDVIAPLIRVKPCEVLVNFMTGHIQRFISDERAGLRDSFRKLFGDDSYGARIEGLEGQAREDAIVMAYAERLSAVGGYPYASTALVLRPTEDRTHYHLVYATRNLKGIEVFKDAERKALKLSEVIRADAKRRAREAVSGQGELFGGQEIPETEHLARLQTHFEKQAEQALFGMAEERRDWEYDDLYAAALRFPTVQETFLKRWLRDRADIVHPPTDRGPKIRNGHRVRFRAT